MCVRWLFVLCVAFAMFRFRGIVVLSRVRAALCCVMIVVDDVV